MLTKLQPRVKLSDAVVSYFLSRIKTDDDVQVLDNYWDSPKQPDLSKPVAKLNLISGIQILILYFYANY